MARRHTACVGPQGTGAGTEAESKDSGIGRRGTDPVMMLTGPIPATSKVLKMAGLTLDDVGEVEINEAFASVPLAWGREYQTGLGTRQSQWRRDSLGTPRGKLGVSTYGDLPA